MPHSSHRVEVANVHFGEALHDAESMRRMFEHRPAAVALQEVWPLDRVQAAVVADRYGYNLHMPRAPMDLVTATRPDIEVVASAEHAIAGRRLAMIKNLTPEYRRRDPGLHAVTLQRANSRWRVNALNSHPVPPPLQLVTKQEIWQTHDILAAHYPSPSDGIVSLLVRDGNHFPRPYRRDTAALARLGYAALIEEGTTTCIVGDTHPLLGRVLRACGAPDPQLDSAYVAVPAGYELIRCPTAEHATTLTPHQIGVAVELGRIASDHMRYGITLHLPE